MKEMEQAGCAEIINMLIKTLKEFYFFNTYPKRIEQGCKNKLLMKNVGNLMGTMIIKRSFVFL